MVFLFIAFLKKKKGVEKLGRMKNGLFYTCSFFHKSNAEKSHLSFPTQQRLHKLRFLKKLGCQKPCWDMATLSNLVNKQVGAWVKPSGW